MIPARDYNHIDRYLNILSQDVYSQPSDAGHTEWRKWIFEKWISGLYGLENLLDLGCGDGFCSDFSASIGVKWTGVTLEPDYTICKNKGLDVYNADFNFLPFHHNSFDLVCAFHSLEHSFSPLISLLHWWEISKRWLCVVLPNPEHFTVDGLNHYSVMYNNQFRRLCKRAGWRVIWDNNTEFELRYMCEKVEPDKY